MKQTMSLSEFKEFCEGITEVIYIYPQSGVSNFTLRVIFDRICVVPSCREVNVSNGNTALLLKNVTAVFIRPVALSIVEITISCEEPHADKSERYVFIGNNEKRA